MVVLRVLMVMLGFIPVRHLKNLNQSEMERRYRRTLRAFGQEISFFIIIVEKVITLKREKGFPARYFSAVAKIVIGVNAVGLRRP